MIFFLYISINMCFGYSKELPSSNGSFEYPHLNIGREIRIQIILDYALLSGGLYEELYIEDLTQVIISYEIY